MGDYHQGVLVGRHDLRHRPCSKCQFPQRHQTGKLTVPLVRRRRRVVVIQAAVRAGHLAEDPMLEAQGETIAVAQQHLGVAEKLGSLRWRCKMQAAQRITLHLCFHLHQGVAAQQQVHPRDRRVPDQVVATEDHPRRKSL